MIGHGPKLTSSLKMQHSNTTQARALYHQTNGFDYSKNTPGIDRDRAIEIAKDPASSPYNLEDLSRHPSREVRRLVACNPNTPESNLRILWESWPEAILENPITDIWELTDTWPLHRRVDHPVLWAWYHYFIRTGQIEKMLVHIPEEVRLGFPLNQGTLDFWMAEDPSWKVRGRIAERSTHPEVQASLIKDSEREVRIALARNRGISSYCHRAVASDPDRDVLIALAGNTDIKGDIENSGLGILAFCDDDAVRVAAASNPLMPNQFMARHCVWDECVGVRVAVAENPGLDKRLHQLMQKTGDVEVLLALARNRAADAGFLERLAESKDPVLRAMAAANPKTPEEQQLALYEDRESAVRNAFVGQRRYGSHFIELAIEKGGRRLKCELAVRAGLKREQLLALSKDPDRHVRQAVVNRLMSGRFQHDTLTNRTVVEVLSRDKDPNIRKSMVTDYRLNESRLNEMAEDSDPEVRIAVACQHNTGRAGLALLVADKNPSVRHHAAVTILDKGWIWGRHNAILCASDAVRLRSKLFMVKQLLKGLVHDPCLRVRRLLAGHTCTPAQILCKMLNDSDQQVRESIRKRSRFPRDEMIRLIKEKPDWPFSGAGMTLNEKVLSRLANKNNEYTRGLVARNCRTPVGILRTLARDESEFVRAKLEENPKYKRIKK
ncbi:MAG: hypothetical protein VB959_04075 [Rhodospirillales bacterium]